MKVRFIAPEKIREFKAGQIMEAEQYTGPKFSVPLLIIQNAQGESYGYPASWFEVIDQQRYD